MQRERATHREDQTPGERDQSKETRLGVDP